MNSIFSQSGSPKYKGLSQSILDLVTGGVKISLVRIFVSVIVVLTITITLFVYFVVVPFASDVENLQERTQASLLLRNKAIMRSSVSLGVSNIEQLLTATESAVSQMISSVRTPQKRGGATTVIPLEKELLTDGPIKQSLKNDPLYPGRLITTQYPQIYYPFGGTKGEHKTELVSLRFYWPSFLQVTQRLHALTSELKWLYLSSSTGLFMVFPASPTIPAGYDPRVRPWYTEAIKQNEGYWTPPYYTAGGNDIVLTFSQAVGEHPVFNKAVVGADLALSAMISHVLSLPMCDDCKLFLINEKNEVIAQKDQTSIGDSWQNTPPVYLIDDVVARLLGNGVARDQIKTALDQVLSQDTGILESSTNIPHVKEITLTGTVEGDNTIQKHAVFSASIDRLNWHLLGIIVNNSPGNDGLQIVSKISDHSKKIMSNFTTTVVMVLVLVFLVIILVYLIFKKTMQNKMQPALLQFKNLADSLDAVSLEQSMTKAVEGVIDQNGSMTHEHQVVVDAIKRLGDKLISAEKQIEKKSKLEAIGKLASQVAHDIQSPLVALNMVIRSLKDVSEENRIQIRSAIQRIDDIANDLASKKTDNISAKDETDEQHKVYLLSGLIEMLISEKRMQHRLSRGLLIESALNKSSYGLFAKIKAEEFKRVLSNIINNAVESMHNKEGRVTVGMTRAADQQRQGYDQDNIQIVISDNGRGIPKNVLPKLMRHGASFNKEQGTGLGLHHALETVKGFNGDIKIESEEGKGTDVIITLPQAEAPDWFLPEIRINTLTRIVVLDDDDTIHQVWQSRFVDAGIDRDRLIHFTSAEDLICWFGKEESRTAPNLFLCDFELLGQETNGLKVIEKLGVASDAVLVTSRFEERAVRADCARLKIKLLPKNLAGFVPIICDAVDIKSSTDAVLIDDDKLIQSAWVLEGKRQNMQIEAFTTPEEFFKQMDRFNKNTNIYVDQNLGGDIKGVDVSKEIHKKGFKRVYLATGYRKEKFPPMPWLKGITGKEFPFGTDEE
ncbi:MAG: hypothetical protein HQM16_16460 [Deltaproteobacteria bacterium]|nr:hypothetical protein [Deltaproteobacteria bacterium]